MDAKEAYKLLMNKKPKSIIVSCFEYDTIFVFDIASSKTNGETIEVFDSLYSVNKYTGEIRNFKPIDIPIEEYETGEKIKLFER